MEDIDVTKKKLINNFTQEMVKYINSLSTEDAQKLLKFDCRKESKMTTYADKFLNGLFEEKQFELYAVMNSDGQFMRAKGYSGGGDSWVDTIENARIYGKIGPAKARVTYWGRHYPEYPSPKVVVLTATIKELIDRTEHIEKYSKKMQTRKEEWEVKLAKERLEKAERDLERAKCDFNNKIKGV